MGKHTPGPWDIDDYGAGNGNCVRFEIIAHPSGRNPEVICEIEDASVDGYGSKRPDARQCAARDLANARLIAAAPELLEACKLLLMDLTTDAARQAMGRYYSPKVWEDRVAQARAAIAKATA